MKVDFDIYRRFLATDDIQIPDDLWEFIKTKIFIQEYKKKDIISRENEVEQYLSFMVKGAVRHYANKGEKEITIRVFLDNYYVTSYESFLRRVPSQYNIEALTDVILIRYKHEDLEKLYETYYGNLIGRKSVEKLYLMKADREISFLLDSPEERYLSMLKNNKDLINNIPLKYLAQYIGITPQALSRIRKRIC